MTPSLPSTSTSSLPAISLPCRSKVGTKHAPLDYDITSHAFSVADMTEQGIQARAAVQRQLTSHVLHPEIGPIDWNASTLPDLTALEQSEHFDNKHYAAIETRYLVGKAKARVESIRRGDDPDVDVLSIQPRWNCSAKLEDDEGHLHLPDKLARFTHHNVLPETYQSLIEKEQQFEAQQRDMRQQARERRNERLAAERQALEYEAKEAWNGPLQPVCQLEPANTLTLRNPPSEIECKKLQENLMHHISNYDALATETAHQSPVLQSCQQPSSRPNFIQEPFIRFRHSGHYTWIENEAGENVKQWSCCHNRIETARGCKKASEAHDKARLVPRSNMRSFGSQNDADGKIRAKVVRFVHNGVYASNAVDKVMQWSCCSTETFDSLGCTKKVVVDETKWNIEKPA